ncbi:hypothetical protein [Polaromonas sp. YR568]|uniref:hypothetical protein n=1 Tax=Polaromonas sp. YR568 TaxID=1855301 RepID=UPI00398BF56B
MNRQSIWLAMSYAWTEIGLDTSEYPGLAAVIDAAEHELDAFDGEALGVVCGAFALNTLLNLATLGMSMPDWGYDDEYVIKKVQKWRNRPLILSLLNPLWLAGHPLITILVLGVWWKLRKAVVENIKARDEKAVPVNQTKV